MLPPTQGDECDATAPYRPPPPPRAPCVAADASTVCTGRVAYDDDYYDDEGPSNLEAGLAVGAVAVVGAAIGAMVGGLIGYRRGRNNRNN